MSEVTTSEEHRQLEALVAPWLPGAKVDTLYVEERCGCYSEWTTESPKYEVTFKAPRPNGETDRQLSDIARILEGVVMQFALDNHEFTGCSCCCGDEDDGGRDYSDVRPSLWVRIIPVKEGE